jgi:hypothetical protein
MPIGPPFHVPEPKSALSPAVPPMLAIQAADWELTGRPDTSACQNESAGVIGHDGAPGTGPPSARAAGIRATRTSNRLLATRGVTPGESADRRARGITEKKGRQIQLDFDRDESWLRRAAG